MLKTETALLVEEGSSQEEADTLTPGVLEELTLEGVNLDLILPDSVFVDALVLADKFQLVAKSRKQKKELEERVVERKKGPSVRDAYRVATEEKISPEYLTEALGVLNPSVEQQLEDVKRFNIYASDKVREHNHQRLMEQYNKDLMCVLQRAFPSFDFERGEGNDWYYPVYRITEEKKKKGIIFKKITVTKKRHKFFRIDVDLSNFSVMVYDPIFISGCGEEFERITEKYFSGHKMFKNYDYSIE
ncbi:hypothetical protein GOV03_04405 [Candidatus Woesearchaeota archaeon]|nr:hypothetical protein [Candidatus Woesearchaeota archaeon]